MTEEEAWHKLAIFVAWTEGLADAIDLRLGNESTRRYHYRKAATNIKQHLPTVLEALDTLNPNKED